MTPEAGARAGATTVGMALGILEIGMPLGMGKELGTGAGAIAAVGGPRVCPADDSGTAAEPPDGRGGDSPEDSSRPRSDLVGDDANDPRDGRVGTNSPREGRETKTASGFSDGLACDGTSFSVFR